MFHGQWWSFFSLFSSTRCYFFFFCLIVWINGCVKCQIDWNAYIFIAGWNNWISCFTISLTTHNDLFDMISNERNELTTHTRKLTNIKHEKTHTHMYSLKEIESIKWSEKEEKNQLFKVEMSARAPVLARCDRGNDDFAVFTFVG